MEHCCYQTPEWQELKQHRSKLITKLLVNKLTGPAKNYLASKQKREDRRKKLEKRLEIEEHRKGKARRKWERNTSKGLATAPPPPEEPETEEEREVKKAAETIRPQKRTERTDRRTVEPSETAVSSAEGFVRSRHPHRRATQRKGGRRRERKGTVEESENGRIEGGRNMCEDAGSLG